MELKMGSSRPFTAPTEFTPRQLKAQLYPWQHLTSIPTWQRPKGRTQTNIRCVRKTERRGKRKYPSERRKPREKQVDTVDTKNKQDGYWRFVKVPVPVEKDPGKDHIGVSDALMEAIARYIKFPVPGILPKGAFSVVRKSFDARKCLKEPKFVYTVDMDVKEALSLQPRLWDFIPDLCSKAGKLEYISSPSSPSDLISLLHDCKGTSSTIVPDSPHGMFRETIEKKRVKENVNPSNGSLNLSKHKVVVVGSGPAGLFASLVLAELGANVTMIERGQPVEKRGRDIGALIVRRQLKSESNLCFGEGGAGTWSDGKLITKIGKNSDNVQMVLKTLIHFGAPECILIDGKPHLGTDKLVRILLSFRQHLQELGVQIMFGTRMDDLLVRQTQVVGVQVSDAGGDSRTNLRKIECDAVILAVGHSARDVYEKLLEQNVLLIPKDFSVGFRIEHPQEVINKIQGFQERVNVAFSAHYFLNLETSSYSAQSNDLTGFLASSMNTKFVLADILELLKSHLRERHKKSCQVSIALQKTGGSDDSTEGGSLLNSQKIESISDLNQSLKLNDRSPLLDAALSIMGYQVPQISDTTTSFLINTLTSILQSTITCKLLSKASCSALQKSQNEASVSHCIFDMTGPNKEQNWLVDVDVYQQLFPKQQFLQIGTAISANDFSKIVKACETIFGNLQAYVGRHSNLLINRLLRVATSISSFQGQFPLSCRLYKKVEKEKSSLVDFVNLSAEEDGIRDLKFDSFTRLLAWRFQPLLLKQDMSNLLLEAVKRPLLDVKYELQHRYAWNAMVISLAAAPEIFAEARSLLHKWFLQTGAYRVLEVQIELVSAILDVLSRPSSWGMPLDADLNFPSSHGFFCQRLQPLLMVLMGPLSYGNLLTILNILEEMQSWEEFNSTTIQSLSSNKGPSEMSLLVDHNSAWALLLDFPTWFHFASMLLFQQDPVEFSEAQHGTESHDSELVHSNNVTEKVDKVKSSSFDSFYNAAKYLAWVLSPLEVSHRDLVVSSLVKTAKSWKPWRSMLICSEKSLRVEETFSQHNSLDWECEIKVNRKRRVSSLASERSGLDFRHKRAKVECVHDGPAQNNLHEMDTGDNGLEKSPQAVIMWLADFSRSCSELCIEPVMSNLLHMKTTIYRGTQSCEGWSERQPVRTENKTGGLPQKAGTDAWVTRYSFLRRIPLGLFLANVHLLNEYACHLLLHFVAAEEGSVPTPGSAAGTYYGVMKNPCANLQGVHANTSLYPRNSVEMNMCAEEPAHRTEGFRESTLSDCRGERKINWVRVTAFILGFFDMLDFNYHVFENAKSCQILWSQVKEKSSKFLVSCIKMLLESRDLNEPRLLTDLRCRLVERTHHGETLFDKGTLCQDILPELDSEISLLQASR